MTPAKAPELSAGSVRSPASADHSALDPEAALRLWVVLSRAHQAIAEHAQDDVKRHGLSIGEFAVLEALFHKGPLLLGEIRRRVLVSSGGITFLVDKLADKGLVERKNCPSDRRARYAALTAEGEKFIRRIFPSHARRIAAAMAELSPAEQAEVAALLKRLGLGAAQRMSADDPSPDTGPRR